MNPPSVSRLVVIVFAVLGLALMAQYTIQLPESAGNIPITGQSLGVLLIAYLLGLRDGSLAILLYLLLGVLGLPVYADGGSGLDALTGVSGGFLYGFLLTCLLTNAILDHTQSDHRSIFEFMTLGTVLILVFGGLHLRLFLEWGEVWIHGIEPFLPGAMIKLVLAYLVAYGVRQYVLVDRTDQVGQDIAGTTPVSTSSAEEE